MGRVCLKVERSGSEGRTCRVVVSPERDVGWGERGEPQHELQREPPQKSRTGSLLAVSQRRKKLEILCQADARRPPPPSRFRPKRITRAYGSASSSKGMVT